MGNGLITSHALMSLEARGILFVTPGMDVSKVFSLVFIVNLLNCS